MYILIIVAILLVDQYSKVMAIKHLKGLGLKKISFIELRYVENRGAAMGLLKKHPIILKGFTSLLLVGLTVYNYFLIQTTGQSLLIIGVTIIIGGGLGNLIDRFTRGYVVDFYSVTIKKLPYFNIADFFVILGSFLLIFSEIQTAF